MARKSISSGGLGRANQRKRNSVLARAFFVVLVVVAVVLSGLALHLTRQIKREGDQRLVAAGESPDDIGLRRGEFHDR